MIPPTEEQMLSMYRKILQIRLFEREILSHGEEEGLAIHSCAGHEAVAVGVCSQLTNNDLVVSNHRPWGHFLAKGGNLKESFAEIRGSPKGVCKGIGGEMGISKPEIGFIQSTMIVGACLTIACGVALSLKLSYTWESDKDKWEKDNSVAVVFFGEGASTNGAFNEAMILAKTFKLPLLFICENNGLSGNTTSDEYLPTPLVTHRAVGYGFPSNVCDGTDVLAVWEAAQNAINYVRQERQPYFLECLVQRINRHKVPRMPDTRTPEIKRIARMRDPLLKFRTALLYEGILNGWNVSDINLDIEKEITEAIEFAKE
jgi:TPP-dependent pyruvate/acetoin dehydrogenase alpha subunit